MDWATTKSRVWAELTLPLPWVNAVGVASLIGLGVPIGVAIGGGVFPIIGNLFNALKVELDVVRYSSDFELNGIPACHMTIAVGRRADDVRQIAVVHRIIHNLKQMVPISLYKQVSSAPAPKSEAAAWPQDRRIRIFRGYVTASGFRRTETSLEFTLHVIHWLSDLNFSSSLSRTSHHSNPGQVSFNAAFPDIAITGGAAVAPHMVADTIPANFFPASVVTEDFWGYGTRQAGNQGERAGGLKEFFRSLSSQDRIYRTPFFQQVLGQPNQANIYDEQNWEALRALKHFEPNANYDTGLNAGVDPTGTGLVNVQETGYVDGVPLQLDLVGANGIVANHIAMAISLNIARETFSTLAGFTIWDKLVGQLAPTYLFSVVPMVEKAICAPFTPGLRWDGTKKGARLITSGDYHHFEYTSFNNRPLKGVFLMTSLPFNTGAETGRNLPPVYQGFGPKYLSEEKSNVGGTIIFKDAPSWMMDVSIPFLFPSLSPPFATAQVSDANANSASVAASVGAVVASFGGNPAAVAAAVAAAETSLQNSNDVATVLAAITAALIPFSLNNPAITASLTAVLTAVLARQTTELASVFSGLNTFWDRYAQSLYVQEVTKGRQAILSGRLRYDTAPGTIVKIETANPNAPACQGGMCELGGYQYGMILRVSCWEDAENNRSGTSFQIGFLHDEQEETNSDTSVVRHPVWSQSFYGSPLVVTNTPASDPFRHWTTPAMPPSDMF